jgi:hypothetical protein
MMNNVTGAGLRDQMIVGAGRFLPRQDFLLEQGVGEPRA